MTILFVDNNPDLVSPKAEHLRHIGHDVDIAFGYQSAQKKASRGRYDTVVVCLRSNDKENEIFLNSINYTQPKAKKFVIGMRDELQRYSKTLNEMGAKSLYFPVGPDQIAGYLKCQ